MSLKKQQLTRIVSYLLNEQWLAEDCWACQSPEFVTGGFSESMSSSVIRIDYVQHALSAIGHGAKYLDLDMAEAG